MMTLYTAVGNYQLKENCLPTILSGGRECALDNHELILWSSLAFRILTYDELKAEFYERERELHILGELDFDHYLNRLAMRRLIASGRDCTGVDALYDLLGHLYLRSVPSGILVRLVTFFKLWLTKGFSFQEATQVLHTEKLEPMERQVMDLIRDQMLSTSELIQCAEKGKQRMKSNAVLMKCLYSDSDTDCETIITDSRFLNHRLPVLTAIANLYLKQQIVFDML